MNKMLDDSSWDGLSILKNILNVNDDHYTTR